MGPEEQLYTPELQASDFKLISMLVRETCGINLHAGKVELVKARLGKRLRELGLLNFHEYIERLRLDHSGIEFAYMLDALSTNVTNFFRESHHFDFLKKTVIPQWQAKGIETPMRFWSAGCATGEEPYSLAITLQEALPGNLKDEYKILASDLSRQAIQVAKNGRYEKEKIATLSPWLLEKYFRYDAEYAPRVYQLNFTIRKKVLFSRMNLMETWPMRGPIHVILCRNVMIYFDKFTKESLVQRFWKILGKGGYLLIGHAESFAGMKQPFKYIAPTIYQKV